MEKEKFKIEQIVACPSDEEIRQANQTLSQWHLHYYQLLYNRDLTNPGPFEVKRQNEHYPALAIVFTPDPSYTFYVSRYKETDQMVDDRVLESCRKIQEAHQQRRRKINMTYSCCPLDTGDFCVCCHKTNCVIHGSRCHGTHD